MELEHMFGEIDAEDVDFHDEPPRVRLGRQCPPKGGAGSISVKSGGKKRITFTNQSVKKSSSSPAEKSASLGLLFSKWRVIANPLISMSFLPMLSGEQIDHK
ncbi:hypothetical protein [Cupriavidus sp. DF5525]|uniref:hypothetical protein n=1 Tax=Cupriavidus sp. DF5525 TaxID=3160989 RepID=UPI0032E038DD